jgi:hypothetical protein
MALKSLNSIDGFSVGSNGNVIIDGAGNITTNSIIVSQFANLGNVANVKITGGTSGQVIQTDGAGNLSFGTFGGFGNLVAPMPTLIPTASSYTVSSNFQGLFGTPITINGELVVDGVLVDVAGITGVSNTQIIFNDTGNTTGNANLTFNKTTATLSTVNVNATGNITVAYTPATATGYGITISAANTQGGTGFADFLKVTNTSGGATNPNKSFRLNSTGAFEIINSAYTGTLLSLSDTGNLNIAGQYQVSGKQAVNGPAFSAYANATAQTITSGSQQKVLFQTEEFDTNNNYASSRFTPTVEGYYQLNAEVRLDGATGTGEMMIILYKNGTEYKRGTNQSGIQIATNFWAMQVSSVVYANGTGDYFEIYVQQGSGGSVTVTAVNNPAITWFNGCMLRGA